MLRFVLFDLTCFDPADDRVQTEKDLCWLMEALVQRNQDYLRQRPSTPRLYKSGVKWTPPQQLSGDIDEVSILKKALGPAARRGDVRRVLDKIQEALGGEHFCDIGRIMELGGIDCDGLACWRVAELRQAGIQARPFMTSRERPMGGRTYHALVIWPPFGPYNYETSEDPSLLLGMYQPERAADRMLELQHNAERTAIIKRYGRSAIRPLVSTSPTSAFDGASLDAAVIELTGKKVA